MRRAAGAIPALFFISFFRMVAVSIAGSGAAYAGLRVDVLAALAVAAVAIAVMLYVRASAVRVIVYAVSKLLGPERMIKYMGGNNTLEVFAGRLVTAGMICVAYFFLALPLGMIGNLNPGIPLGIIGSMVFITALVVLIASALREGRPIFEDAAAGLKGMVDKMPVEIKAEIIKSNPAAFKESMLEEPEASEPAKEEKRVNYCWNCGERIAEAHLGSLVKCVCGAEIPSKAVYCPECGKKRY
ncbi:MAG TPA: zinc ribbon domain-containing protein [bacterium]|nr:zinc ribbon domain-containing protein [bacterium]